MGEATRRKKAGTYPQKTRRPPMRVVQHEGALFGVDHLERVFHLRLRPAGLVPSKLRDEVLATARGETSRIVRPTPGDVVQAVGGR